MLALSPKSYFQNVQRRLCHFPLHSAVENGDIKKVAEILKTDIIPVNTKNHKGEWPLEIAHRNWTNRKDDAGEIARLLVEYGGTYNDSRNGIVIEFKKYKAEFKAKIAYESLSSQLSLEELALKHDVEIVEVVKWRHQLRENLISLFTDNKA